jgi:hypothetical protein
MVQVRFIAICEEGHLQDFPWNEWVHRSAKPVCDKPLTMYSTGGASLAATWIKCECGRKRSLGGITQAFGNSPVADSQSEQESLVTTLLSRELDSTGDPYLCPGQRPWLGDEEGLECGRSLRGSLRGATNVYFAHTRSAIFLPRETDAVPETLISILETQPVAATRALAVEFGGTVTGERLKNNHPSELRAYSVGQVDLALAIVSRENESVEDVHEDDDDETRFRRAEYRALRTNRSSGALITHCVDRAFCSPDISTFLERVTLVEKLRETRVLTDFFPRLP